MKSGASAGALATAAPSGSSAVPTAVSPAADTTAGEPGAARSGQLAAEPLNAKAQTVRAIARCPACGARLVFERAAVCRNVHCGAIYLFAGARAIPRLLTPADAAEADALMAHNGLTTVPAFGSRTLRLFAPPPPSPCFDPAKNGRLRRFFGGFPREAVLLDVGAQNFNLHPNILNFDMAPFAYTDLIGNAHRLPLADESIDGIVNTGVLEHVTDPDQVVREMARVLKPGGRVYIETPFLQGEHPDPQDFRRYTLAGLTRQCTQFGLTVVEGGMGCGPGSTWAWLARETAAGLFGGRRSFTCMWAWAGWLTFWLKYLDWPFRRRPYIARLASSYYVIAEKPGAAALATGATAQDGRP